MLLNDPAFPRLDAITNANAMLEHFTRYLQASGLEPEWQVARCAIEKIYYRPAKNCGVLYRLAFRQASGAEAEEWFFGRMVLSNRLEERFNKAMAAAAPIRPPHDFLCRVPPVGLWRDFNMILWMFPQDPKMTTLPAVADPAFMRQQVEANLQVLNGLGNAAAAESKVVDIRWKRVKYMPGKRCVLRYHVSLADSSGDSQEVTFYSKTYPDARSRGHFEILRSVCEQVQAQAASVNIPRPLLDLNGVNTFWQDDWKGKALIDAMEDFDAEDLFPRIAGMLAAFHRSRLNGLRPGPGLDEVLQTAAKDGGQLTDRIPELQPRIEMMLERLTAAKAALARQTIPVVPIHGAIRLEQMLARGRELALVDFDDVALGDPLYDVAELIASLQYLELSRGLPRRRLDKAAELFCSRYAEIARWPFDHSRLAWYALAFLIGKMFLSLRNLERRALQSLDSAGIEICNRWLEKIVL
jgi:hypothetical protein